MKHSIYKIFKNLNLLLLLSLTITFLGFLFIIEQYYSYNKVEILQNQKNIINTIIKEQESSNKQDIIQFNADIATINRAIQSLENQNKYNYILIYLTNNSKEYMQDLQNLHIQFQNFDATSRKYFKRYNDDKEHIKLLLLLQTYHTNIIINIDSLIMKNISYDKDRFSIFSKLFAFLLLFILFSTFWQRKRLSNIYKDIAFLYAMDSSKKNTIIFSQEIDAINMRMKRKNKISDNPSMMDPITEINNNKGMIQAYAERKSTQDNNFSSIAILEIDNFSKSKRAFSQDFTQEILKKVAYTISLHEQSSDIIARTDYNQFTLILSRATKEQLFKDVDLVRQSIADIKISSPNKKSLQITITGGFIHKSKNSPLEDSIRKAKELLQSAKQKSTNIVLQTKDLPKL